MKTRKEELNMTWFQLFKRIGKQPLSATQHKDVTVKVNDELYTCKLVYTNNGNDWHLEVDEKVL